MSTLASIVDASLFTNEPLQKALNMTTDDDSIDALNNSTALATLSGSTVSQIEQALEGLNLKTTHDRMLEWLTLTTVLCQRAKEIRQQIEDFAIEWIKTNGPLVNGPITYTVGNQKQVKCTNVVTCIQMILDACEGDLELLATSLRSDPFKYGHSAKLLQDEQFDQVFEVIWNDKLVLKAMSPHWLKQSSV